MPRSSQIFRARCFFISRCRGIVVAAPSTGFAIYGVLPAFTHKHASVRLDVPDEIGSFHHLRRTQDQLFACHFRTGSKSLLEMFAIGFKDQLNRLCQIFACFGQSLALSIRTRQLRDVADKPTFLGFFVNCSKSEFSHSLR